MLYRSTYAIGFIVCVAILGYVLWSQYYLGLVPCPLCIFQRVAFIAVGMLFFIGFIHHPRTRVRLVYPSLICLSALWGIGVAGRQLWLQSLPADKVPACGPGLAYLFDTFGPLRGLKLVFQGSGECAAVDWSFMGLSMAGWSLIWLVMLTLMAWLAVIPSPKLRNTDTRTG